MTRIFPRRILSLIFNIAPFWSLLRSISPTLKQLKLCLLSSIPAHFLDRRALNVNGDGEIDTIDALEAIVETDGVGLLEINKAEAVSDEDSKGEIDGETAGLDSAEGLLLIEAVGVSVSEGVEAGLLEGDCDDDASADVEVDWEDDTDWDVDNEENGVCVIVIDGVLDEVYDKEALGEISSECAAEIEAVPEPEGLVVIEGDTGCDGGIIVTVAEWDGVLVAVTDEVLVVLYEGEALYAGDGAADGTTHSA